MIFNNFVSTRFKNAFGYTKRYEEKMFEKLTISLILIIFKTPVIYADEIIYSYKLNLNFGLQNHVTLGQKDIRAILHRT